MFAAIRAVMPASTDDWDDVADLHAEKFPGRDGTSIRNKFNQLQRKKAPTGNPNMRWDIKEAKEIHQLIGDKSFVVEGEDRYEVERNEFTRPPPPSAASQLVPLLLGQQTQPTQPLLLGQPTQPTQPATQPESQHVRPPEEMMNTIAQVLKLQQQALEQEQQRYQEQLQQYQRKADEERKVLMQAVLAIGGSGAVAGTGTAVGATTSTPTSDNCH
eukprot:jgi/Psemu1/52907/gm1.52907_g